MRKRILAPGQPAICAALEQELTGHESPEQVSQIVRRLVRQEAAAR